MFACASGVTRLLPNSTTLLVAVARAHNVRIEVSLRAVPCNGGTVPTVQTAAEATVIRTTTALGTMTRVTMTALEEAVVTRSPSLSMSATLRRRIPSAVNPYAVLA